MRGLALLLWGVGLIVGLYYGEGASPALKATYTLSADRWKQGRDPYAVLEAPADPLTLWVFREVPRYGSLYLVFLRATGGLLLMGFLLRGLSREESPKLWQGVFVGLIGGIYQVLPYQAPLGIGEVAYVLALYLGENAWKPFLQGVLLSVLIGWQPAAAWAMVFWVYRRWENQEVQALLYHLLGLGWGSLALLAAAKVMWGTSAIKAYFVSYSLQLWRIGTKEPLLWLLNGLSVAVLILFSGEVGRRPYREKVLFRRIVWAAVGALGWGGRALPTMSLFCVRSSIPFLTLAQITLGLGYVGYASFLLVRQPSALASLSLAPQSCYWGMPSLSIFPQGPYGCDLTVPYHWEFSGPDWEWLYQKLDEPTWIYDAAGYMESFRYYLPYKLAPYRAVDTTLPAFIRLYQRKSEMPPLWIRVRPEKGSEP